MRSLRSPGRIKGLLVAPALGVAALALAACGSGTPAGGTATLNLWVFQEPSGSFTDAARRCSEQSGGRYRIAGMDVVWTAEFASEGWIKPWPERFAAAVRRGTLAGPLKTATYQRRLWAAPANTNTQLLCRAHGDHRGHDPGRRDGPALPAPDRRRAHRRRREGLSQSDVQGACQRPWPATSESAADGPHDRLA